MGDFDELALHAVMDHLGWPAVVALEIVMVASETAIAPRDLPRRGPHEKIPERQIEPAKIFRMPLVLQIVKHRHHAGNGTEAAR